MNPYLRPFCRISAPFTALVLLAGAAIASAQNVPGWSLVWADEFEQADGTAPDPTKWTYDLGGGGWGNQEIQYYTNRTENARIESNELIIEVREETNYAGSGLDHTSARLLTKGLGSWQYGRFEARIKVPSGSGLWPAFWTLGSNIDVVGWPFCGEIDVMEFVGRLPTEVFGTIHGPGYAGGDSFGNIYDFGVNVPDDYHVYVVEWEEDLIRWYVDGILYHTATPADVAPNAWVFDHDFFMLLNVAVGGNFGGTLDPNVTFPKQMKVDYVRVYSRSPDANQLQNPGLETGGLGAWIPYAAGGANDPGAFVESTGDTYYNGGNGGGDNVLTHSGTFTAKVFGDFTGAENYNGFYQDVTVEAGSEWNADGWMLTHPQDLMSGTNTSWIEVLFMDDSDTVLSLYRSQVLTSSNVTPAEWENVIVNQQYDPTTYALMGSVSELVAPVGATKARYQTVYRQQAGYDGGSMYFDDLNFNAVVEAPPLEACLEAGTIVSWNAQEETSSFQLQESSDGSNWADVGVAYTGTSVDSYFTTDPASFYQVVESTAASLGNGVDNPSFEQTEVASYPNTGAVAWTIAAPEDTDPSDGSASMTAETSFESHLPRTGSSMLVIESTTPAAPASVNAPNTDVRSPYIEVDESADYDLSFYAKNAVKVGGANPQFVVRFFGDTFGYINQTGFESFASVGTDWTEVTSSFTTPAGASYAQVSWIQALGAGNDWNWVTLIDDVEIITDNLPGTDVILPVTMEEGFELSWNSVFGQDYQVVSSDNLQSFPTQEATYTGTGDTLRHGLTKSLVSQFFRVEEVTNNL